eukprot:3935533-Rhodomonas_salina.1
MTAIWTHDIAGLSVLGGPNRGGSGSSSVTVHGTGMGASGYTVKMMMGQTGCEGTEWEAETSV